MSLSDYEKEVLAQMEAQLSDQDPKLVDQMRESTKATGLSSAPRRVAFGIVLMLIGVVVLVGGLVLTPYLHGFQFVGTVIGVIGFVVVVLGVLQIFGIGAVSKVSSTSRRPAAARSGAKFMDRQQEKWDRRQRPGF